jgi:DNA modification methylase
MAGLTSTGECAVQGELDADCTAALGVHGTFFPNYRVAVHRWYPYIEGFSSNFVQRLIDEFARPGDRVYDPFAGTGTTTTVAAANQLLPFYSEINPFMRLVIECKTNVMRQVARRKTEFATYLGRLQKSASRLPAVAGAKRELKQAFGDRQYFSGRRLVEIVALRRAVLLERSPPLFRDLARLALAAIAVGCSEMKRAADLRYRTDAERLPADFSPLEQFRTKTRQILADIDVQLADLPSVTCLSESALAGPPQPGHVDLVITSPPYLNGTNYFRNTKLELWLTGILTKESELAAFRDMAVAAGINNISRRGRTPTRIPCVEAVATQLDDAAYDRRIPELIRRYFSDAVLWIGNLAKILRAGARAIIDIGDSRFAGIHVPTDALLAQIAESHDFHIVDTCPVRTRQSKDGEPLKQVLLVLQKPSRRRPGASLPATETRIVQDDYRERAVRFARELPHLESPYCSRNWGHGLHSLCSYQGKLKPAIAHFLVKEFSAPGETLLDPFSGCGTIPLEAFLQGRRPLGNDLQELGFILTQAKVQRGPAADVLGVQDDLLKYVDAWREHMDRNTYGRFGFNGRVPEYFHADTYREVLAARKYMVERPCVSWSQAVVYSGVLHILHGNRPYALSRRSHPVTPFKPGGPCDYRPLAPRLRDKVARTLSERVPTTALNGTATLGCFGDIQAHGTVDVVITSPPFAASTRFFSSNWMRLWMAGWEPGDFKSRRSSFVEYQQLRSMDVYRHFFTCAANWLRPEGRLIIHAGRNARTNMAEKLIERAGGDFQLVYSFDEDVAGREKFGVRDQGATTSHQYLFFRRTVNHAAPSQAVPRKT